MPWWTPSNLETRTGDSTFSSFLYFHIGISSCQAFNKYSQSLYPTRNIEEQKRQDHVFVRPPDAGKDFRVSISTVWYCRVLLLFSFYTSTESGIKRHDCAFMSLLWDCDKDPPGAELCWIILNITNSYNFRCFCTEWLLDCHSRIEYARRPDNQVFYILWLESILGKLPVVPIGDTGTIPYSVWQHAEDFVALVTRTAEKWINPASHNANSTTIMSKNSKYT